MIGTFSGIVGVREVCNHNLRFRLPSKSNICLICHCNKIDDVLSTENSGKRKLSTTDIHEIIHQFRILNSVLDVPIDAQHLETLLSPVLQTSLAALKIHNDEIGTVVSQALKKIAPKVPQSLLENFLEKLSAQILEKASFGNLECLSVLIRRKECLHTFITIYGSILLPPMFQLLEKHVARIIFKCPSAPSLMRISKPSTAASNVKDSSAERKESLRLVEKLFDILEASCPSDISVVVTDNENGVSQPFSCIGSRECFQIFRQYMKEVIGACMNLLSSSETTQMFPFHVKVLRFLEKLYHHPETLRFIFSDRTGVEFCSMIKRLLFTHSVDVKTAALYLVNRMLVTHHNHPADEICADQALIADFPSVISQVDLIHFITEAMNTSSESLFRVAIQVLDQINLLPLFRQGRMIQVLESTLRISTMRIPDNINDLETYTLLNRFLLNILASLESIPHGIYRQLMYLFERLPKEWTASQYLPWIQLLIFCGRDAELQRNLWNVFVSFVQRSKNLGNYYCVTPLKCVLLIASALMECKFLPNKITGENETSDPPPADPRLKILPFMMDVGRLPAFMTLFRHGTSDDSIYLIILLELLKVYPEQCLTLQKINSSGQTIYKTCQVAYDSPMTDNEWTENQKCPVYEVVVNQNSVMKMEDGFWYWTPKVLVQSFVTIRLNSEFMVNRRLFELWNENMSRILTSCCTYHLPQLHTKLRSIYDYTGEDETDETTLSGMLKRLLGELDIDATCWSKMLGDDWAFSSLTATKSQLQDAVLSYYFCYALCAGKDIDQLLDSGFPKRLSNFLESCLERYNETQEIQEFGWTEISFYFRVGLKIASCLPRNSEDAASLSAKLKLLSAETLEFQRNFKYDVMIYQSDVFIFLFREGFFLAYEQLVEIWLCKDRNGCISFFSGKSEDEQLDTEINNCLVAMAARGNKETSVLAVELGSKRLKKFKTGFEFTFFMENMHHLIRQILTDETSEQSRNSINLSRLSNVMQLVVQDEFLLSLENHFPLEILHQLVMIMLKFHDVAMIGRKCLELLCKILRDNITFRNEVTPYLASSNDFICYLGSKLYITNVEDAEESVYAHKLLTLLIRQKMKGSSTESQPNGTSHPLITWKLATVISYIHSIPKVEIWEFIATMFKVNFKCDLVQVEEINTPEIFAISLLNLLFHVQALTHKVSVKAAKDAIWDILCEYLRIASEDNEFLKTTTFKNDVLFQPWMKITVLHLLSGCKHVPSKLSLKSLEFLQKWTKLMLKNKLENPSKRSPILENMVFRSYVDLYKTISDVMKRDRTQGVSKERQNQSGGPSRNLMIQPEVSHIFDIEQKTKLIGQIAKSCDIFLSSL